MNNWFKKIDMATRLIGIIILCNASAVSAISPRMQKLLAKREEKIKQIQNNHAEKQHTPSLTSLTRQPLDQQLPIVLFIYAYNDSEWIQFNLDSALHQEYENYRIIYIDDASTDNTSKKVKHYVESKGSKIKIDIITYTEHQGKLKTMYSILNNCLDEEIVVLLDASDWFSNNYVIKNLSKEYNENDIWLTFGTCTSAPKGCNIGLRNGAVPQAIIENQQFRKVFPFMPTRSFYVGLFKHIQKNDLINPETGAFYEHAAECYVMWPLIEMAHTHFKRINEISYVVNCTNPIAKLVEDYHLRMACNSQIGKQLPVYQPIDKP